MTPFTNEQQIKGIFYDKVSKLFFIFIKRFYLKLEIDLISSQFYFDDKLYETNAHYLEFENDQIYGKVKFENLKTKWIQNYLNEAFFIPSSESSFKLEINLDQNLLIKDQIVSNEIKNCKKQIFLIHDSLYCFDDNFYSFGTNQKFLTHTIFEDSPVIFNSEQNVHFIFNYLDNQTVFLTNTFLYIFDKNDFKINNSNKEITFSNHPNYRPIRIKNCLIAKCNKPEITVRKKEQEVQNFNLIELLALVLSIILLILLFIIIYLISRKYLKTKKVVIPVKVVSITENSTKEKAAKETSIKEISIKKLSTEELSAKKIAQKEVLKKYSGLLHRFRSNKYKESQSSIILNYYSDKKIDFDLTTSSLISATISGNELKNSKSKNLFSIKFKLEPKKSLSIKNLVDSKSSKESKSIKGTLTSKELLDILHKEGKLKKSPTFIATLMNDSLIQTTSSTPESTDSSKAKMNFSSNSKSVPTESNKSTLKSPKSLKSTKSIKASKSSKSSRSLKSLPLSKTIQSKFTTSTTNSSIVNSSTINHSKLNETKLNKTKNK